MRLPRVGIGEIVRRLARSSGMDADADSVAVLADRGYRYAYALTSDHDRAGDVVQDAWVAMLRAGGDIGPGYLFAAIRSRVIDRARRPRLVVVSDPADLPDPAGPDEDDTDEGPCSDDLDAALARLRDDEREALFLTAVEGWSVEAVADHQERPRGTVLSILHRARIKLRRWLGQSRPEEGRHHAS